jgi:hypothetical protein
MVLSLKTWKSRSLPGLRRTDISSSRYELSGPAFAAQIIRSMLFRADARVSSRTGYVLAFRRLNIKKPPRSPVAAFSCVQIPNTKIPQRRLRSRSRLFTENESRALKTPTVIRCERVKSKPLRISLSAFARPIAELSDGLTSRRRSYVAARRSAPSVVSAGAGFPRVCFPRLLPISLEVVILATRSKSEVATAP